jgi:uncharacterized phiE125 gp8 family phage protein
MNYLNGIEIVNDIVTEPLSLTDAKTWLRVTFSTDDGVISSLITSARSWLEQFTGVGFGARKLTAYITIEDYSKDFELPYGPVKTIVKVYDKDGEADLDSSLYELYGGKLRFKTTGEFYVTYTCGYSSLPDPLLQDIKRIVAWGYQNRGMNFSADQGSSVVGFPEIPSLNSNGYKTVVI